MLLLLNAACLAEKQQIPITVDSHYLEFDGTMEKIWVNRSSTQEELWKYRKCSLFNDERETTQVKFWRAKTSIACHDSQNNFKLIQCFCCCFYFSLLNSLNLVEWLITSRYLFFCVWLCLSVLFMFFSCCIVINFTHHDVFFFVQYCLFTINLN